MMTLSKKKFKEFKNDETEKCLMALYDYLTYKFFQKELFFEKNYFTQTVKVLEKSLIKIKKFTGSDVIQTRYLYGGSFVFNPQITSDGLRVEELKENFLINHYGTYTSMLYRFAIIKLLSYDDLIRLKKDVFFYDDYIDVKNKRFFNGYTKRSAFWREIIDINNQLNFLGGEAFKEPLVMSEEEVNGYKLYELSDNIMNYDTFNDYLKLWNKINLNVLDSLTNLDIPSPILSKIAGVSDMSNDEFTERFEEIACSDWSKQDRHGECFGGFWKYPEGSYERENAYTLSREDNLKALLELPYPREFILETISIGCGSRMESVRYSNFLCEWMKRKIASM